MRTFTLTEILVVILILVLLAGFGVYAISHSLRSARTMKCSNHLKLQGIAWQETVAATPLTGVPGLKGHAMPKVQDADGLTWIDQIRHHGLEYPASFLCPEAPRSDIPSYGMNPLIGAHATYPHTRFEGFLLMPAETRPCNVDLLRNPGKRALVVDTARITDATAGRSPEEWVADSAAVWQPYAAFPFTDLTTKINGQTFDYGYDWGNTAPNTLRGGMVWDAKVRPFGRHPQAHCGTLFADGTVKQLPIKELVEPEWNSARCLYGGQ